MAERIVVERYENAIIDVEEGTVVEVREDDMIVHSLAEILDRWDGLPGVTIEISRGEPVKDVSGRCRRG